jgi:Holliday junction resolvasome RuvABC endonuclease subunit
MNKTKFILGLDVSTSVIGMSIFKYDGNTPEVVISESLELKNKQINKMKGLEALLAKNLIFQTKLKEYVSLIQLAYNDKLSMVILEEPLFGSNNILTCGVLMKFNGIISSTVYNTIGVVAEYISSYDARAFAFPQLNEITAYNKKGEKRSLKEITKSLKDKKLVLFGGYPFGVAKKDIVFDLVIEKYPNINVLLDKQGEIRKINYDSSDSIACVLGKLNMDKYPEKPKLIKYDIRETEIIYQTQWNNIIYEHKILL